MGKELFLEIGTEEIPAAFLPGAISGLKEVCGTKLAEGRLPFQTIETYGTPRRLILFVDGLPEKQEDLNRKVLGPARSVAFDADGNPTKAALGFARGQGVDPGELKVEETPKGEYLCAVKREPGLPTLEVLQAVLPGMITSLHFPKSMRWGRGPLRFARPLHWILALFNEIIVPFEIGGIKSSNLSRGHRFMSPGAYTVHSFKAYKALCREHVLVFDPRDRKKEIEKQIARIEEDVGGKVIPDEGLLEEVAYLVEYPTALCGSFEPRFLSLPRPVLITSMREHQRYFSMENERGELIPHFITVSNTRPKDPSAIVAGNERVLRARLTDALYFYKIDSKRPFADCAEDLKRVTFQEKLGTYAEKVERFTHLATWLAGRVGYGDTPSVSRAAMLCKADLCTEMVGEFPSLQGKMGREYALLSGEDETVARAIEEHYQPRFSGDPVPETTEGAVISLADKMDTIAGCFGVGLIPSGSEDPYALRRQTLAIVTILLEKGYAVAPAEIIDETLRHLEGRITREPGAVKQEILDYFRGRISGLLISEGHRYDTVDAVLGTALDGLPDVRDRVEALSTFRKDPLFEPFTVVCKRAVNIIKEHRDGSVDPGLFRHDSEKVLYGEIERVEEKVGTLISKSLYQEALTEIASLRHAIDAFFDGVMVMDEEDQVRQNRLALLNRVAGLVSRIADFSKIVID